MKTCYLLPVLLITLMLPPTSSGQNNEVVQWETNHLQSILGDMTSETLTASFRSTKQLKDVTLWVAPELQPYTTVAPQSFDLIEPGISYQVQITTSIPESAFPDTLDGTVHLRQGKKTIPETLKLSLVIYYENAIPYPTTKFLHENTTNNLDCTLSSDSIIAFSVITDELSSLAPNDVIILGQTECTPNGFLGRVSDIYTQNDVVYILTEPASLLDAFETLHIHFSHTYTSEELATTMQAIGGVLAASNSCEPQNPLFTFNRTLTDGQGNKVKVTGSLGITITPEFDLDIEPFWPPIDYLRFVVTIGEQSSLKIEAEGYYDAEKTIEIGDLDLGCFCIYGVWICPELTLYAGVNGNVSASATAELGQKLDIQAGVEYTDGQWDMIFSKNTDYCYDLFSNASININAKGFLEPELALMIYGSAGPTASVEGYLRYEAEGIPSNFWWDLYAGIDAKVGVKGEILGIDLFNKSFTVYDDEWLIASGPEECFSVDFSYPTITADGITLEIGPGFVWNTMVEPGSAMASWKLLYPGISYFKGTFNLDFLTDLDLTVTHLSSAYSGCPGGGYSPIDIVVNDTDSNPFNETNLLVNNYDVAENHGYSHGFETDTFAIPSSMLHLGSNTITFAFESDPWACTHYWIQGMSAKRAESLFMVGNFASETVGINMIQDSINDTDVNKTFDIDEAIAFQLYEAGDVINGLSPESFDNKESAIKLTNTIDAMFAMLDGGLYLEALGVLDNDVLQRLDGCADTGQPDEGDWIRSVEGQALVYPLVVETIELLESII